jgi:ABC-type dipeptide/oligopeptide/nickel transport system permease component
MGLSGEMSRIIAGVNGTSYFLTASIAIFVIERLGRRNLLLWTCVLMGATMAILAGLYDLVYNGNKAAQVISVLCLFLFNSWFSVGWLGMTWLYPAEITPLRIRAVSRLYPTATGNALSFIIAAY